MSLSKSGPERECGRACRSRQHGTVLTSAITKRAVSDAALASYLRASCHNFYEALDEKGRTVLHMAASRGRQALVEWLGRHGTPVQGSSPLDVRDVESGYTALHRSLFYGQIQTAVSLMRLGASTSVMDNDDFTAVDHAMLDRFPVRKPSLQQPCEVYVWGSNSNYTSGTGSQQPRSTPELLSIFTKRNIYIKQVCLSKFHSTFVSSTGGVWACGHGEGGRLGVALGGTCVLPTSLALTAPCEQAAVARDHSLFLMQSGIILSCGLNDHGQLGQAGEARSQLTPKAVRLRLAQVKGVRAARYHSAAFSSRAIYTWGRHGGQLGHPKDADTLVTVPRKVVRVFSGQDDATIECVAVSDGATVASNSRGDIYLMTQYQCRRIASRQHNIKSIEVVGGEVVGGDKLTEQQKQILVLMLTSVGNIYLWQDTTNQFMRCIFSMSRPVIVMETALTRDCVMLTTSHGEAFHGYILPRKLRSAPLKVTKTNQAKQEKPDKPDFNGFLERDDCITVKLKRLPNVHRAVGICSDTKGNNFAVLQESPNNGLLKIPQVTSSQLKSDLAALLEESSEYDSLHDIIVKVETSRYPVHRFVFSHGCEHFAKLCDQAYEGGINTGVMDIIRGPSKPIIELNNVHPKIFEQILQFLYTGSCDLTTLGACKVEIKKEENPNKNFVEQNGNNQQSALIIDDFNPAEISAFEVYQKKEKNKKSNSKKEKEKQNRMEANNRESLFQDPVRLLQETAKRLHITELYKLLDKFYYSNGYVMKKDGSKAKGNRFSFDRRRLTELWDASIKCADGVIIRAHKCILAARLDYFNGMFTHGWTENSAHSNITLPMPSNMLKLIIDFLYTDECPEIRSSEDVDFLCNMLIISDQFFITRMREMCEVAFSSLLTLKNVSEILQLANTYNCPQLKECCMEYICINLPSLFESRALEIIDSDLLKELSEFYCNFNPAMSSRVITPFADAVSDEIIHASEESYPIGLMDEIEDEVCDDLKRESFGSAKKKFRPRKISYTESERARKRNESTSSITSLDLSTDKNEDITLSLRKISNSEDTESKTNGWVKVLNTQQKQQKIVQARLKAITVAKENTDVLNTYQETFVKLVKQEPVVFDRNLNMSGSPIQSPTFKGEVYGSPRQSSSSPDSSREYDVNNDTSVITDVEKCSQTSLPITVNTKMSQKQRKKLALKGTDMSALANHLDKLNMNVRQPAWESSSAEVAEPVSIKNPWQKLEAAATSLPKNKGKVSFSEILEDERKQKENFCKMMTKPLVLTQMEDKAIEELTRFYNCSEVNDERITVKRVPYYQISAPQWISKSLKTST